MNDLNGLERRIAGQRQLNDFDQEAVETVAALIRRLREAQSVIDVDGVVVQNDRGVPIEHPAVKVERGASSELRGWVKDRPDLFGEQKAAKRVSEKFGGFKAV